MHDLDDDRCRDSDCWADQRHADSDAGGIRDHADNRCHDARRGTDRQPPKVTRVASTTSPAVVASTAGPTTARCSDADGVCDLSLHAAVHRRKNCAVEFTCQDTQPNGESNGQAR